MSKIEIELSEYKNLLKDSAKLGMLDEAGVDNWEWYGDALNPEDQKSYSDLCNKIDEKYPEQKPA